MKATLEFTLPDEWVEHNDAIRGGRYRAVITGCLEALRTQLKYGELEGDLRTGIEDSYRALLNACEENGFDPWEDS